MTGEDVTSDPSSPIVQIPSSAPLETGCTTLDSAFSSSHVEDVSLVVPETIKKEDASVFPSLPTESFSPFSFDAIASLKNTTVFQPSSPPFPTTPSPPTKEPPSEQPIDILLLKAAMAVKARQVKESTFYSPVYAGRQLIRQQRACPYMIPNISHF